MFLAQNVILTIHRVASVLTTKQQNICPLINYRIVASTNTCYYSENQVFGVLQFEFYVVKGGATNRDMSLTETC